MDDTRSAPDAALPRYEVIIPFNSAGILDHSWFGRVVRFRFIDLPGVRTVLGETDPGTGMTIHDHKEEENRELIRAYMEDTIVIFLMDYADANSERRSEAIKLLDYLSPDPAMVADRVLFVLNKADRRTQEDRALAKQLDYFTQQLKDKLSLPDDLSFVNISGLYCYLSVKIRNKHHVPDDINDAFGYLDKMQGNQREMLSIKRKFEDQEPLEPRELLFLGEQILKTSGGMELLKELYRKILFQFFALAVEPGLGECLAVIDEFRGGSEGTCEFDRRLEHLEGLLKEYSRSEKPIYNERGV